MAEFESDFWHPKVATDIVLLTIREKKLNILLVKRKEGKEGLWALPGGYINKGENLETCARRELREEAGIEVPHLEYFKVYSEPERDYRHQTISHAFIAIHPSGKLRLKADTDVSDVNWFEVNNVPSLEFDHNQICSDGIKHARALIEDKPRLAFAFLSDNFTFTELRETYETLGGSKYSESNKRNFQLWLKKYGGGAGLIAETGQTRRGNHRPAKLFVLNTELLRRLDTE